MSSRGATCRCLTACTSLSTPPASAMLRNLKKQARDSERALQKREKEITTRERKVQTVTDQLAGLKDAVGF